MRLSRKYGLRRFAEFADIDPGNLSRLERGKLRPPLDEEITRIARLLKLEVSERDKLLDLARAERMSFVAGKPLEAYIKGKGELIPIMLRSIQDKKLSEDELKKLIEYINDL